MNSTHISERLGAIQAPPERPSFDSDVRALLEAEPKPDVVPFRNRHRISRGISAAVAVAAAIAVAVITIPSTGSSSKSHPLALPPTTTVNLDDTLPAQPLLASAVLQKAISLSDSINAVSGSLDYTIHPFNLWWGGTEPGGEVHWTQFKVTSDGDFSVTLTDKGIDYNEAQWYQAAKNKYVDCAVGTIWNCTTITNPNLPDIQSLSLLTQTSKLRNAVANDSVPVEVVTFEGRSAWKITLNNPAAKGGVNYEPEASTAVIDQESGFPLSLSTVRDGKPFEDYVVHDIKVNPKLTDADFKASIPAGAENYVSDGGFKTTTFAQASRDAGYTALAPSVVPDGFKLTQVTFKDTDVERGYKGADPYEHKIITLTYRRGLSAFIVSTRLTGPKGTEWETNPDGYSLSQNVDPTAVIHGGEFDGITGRYTAAATMGDFWAIGPKLVLAITGDLSDDELLTVAQSMKPAL